MNVRVIRWLTVVVFVFSWTAAGCDPKPKANYSALRLVSVTGIVRLDGEPLKKAVVVFEDKDSSFSYGLTDESGRYTLRYDSEMMGCKPGSKKVEISTTRKILGLNTSSECGDDASSGIQDDDLNAPPSTGEIVPEKYHKRSGLVAEVSSTNRSFNFELTSKN